MESAEFNRRVPALDGVRGIAIVLVILAHGASYAPDPDSPSPSFRAVLASGWIGVDLFFALSGFLITGVLLQTKTEPRYFLNFYMRRVLRIFPLYYFALIAFGTLVYVLSLVKHQHGNFLSGPIKEAWLSLPFCFAYLQNLPMAASGTITQFIGHFWSLAVEEQFYLLWPVLVWRYSDRILIGITIGVLLFAIPLRMALAFYGFNGVSLYTFTLTRLDGLMMGALLALLLHHYGNTPNVKRLCLRMTFLGLIVLTGACLFDGGLSYRNRLVPIIGFPALALISTGILFCAMSGQIPSAFECTFLRRLGRYSYAIYIVHVPLMIGMHYFVVRIGAERSILAQLPMFVLLCGFLSFCLGALSWTLIEQPFLRLKVHFQSAPKPVTTSTPNFVTGTSALQTDQ